MLVNGVSVGAERKLQLVGVGYRVNIENNAVVLNVGYADQKIVPIWKGLTCSVRREAASQVGGALVQYCTHVVYNEPANASKLEWRMLLTTSWGASLGYVVWCTVKVT